MARDPAWVYLHSEAGYNEHNSLVASGVSPGKATDEINYRFHPEDRKADEEAAAARSAPVRRTSPSMRSGTAATTATNVFALV